MGPSATDHLLARLVVAIVQGRWDVVREVRGLAGSGEPDSAWREAVLQTHLFAGFARLVEAYGVLAEAGGLGEPEPIEFEREDVPSERRGAGRALFERIYGDHAEPVRMTLVSYHPDFARWIEEHAYGRVLARRGLDPARREVLAVVALAAQGQERQLVSHARGALRCGGTLIQLREALQAVADLLDPEGLLRAFRLLERSTLRDGY